MIGVWPTSFDLAGNKAAPGQQVCPTPQAAEFVPMFWGFWGNVTESLWPSVRADWKRLGVKAILGFNEPGERPLRFVTMIRNPNAGMGR